MNTLLVLKIVATIIAIAGIAFVLIRFMSDQVAKAKRIIYLKARVDSQSGTIRDCFDRVHRLEAELEAMTAARDRFCHAVNVVASNLGMTGKQCFAPEAVIRRADNVHGSLALLVKYWNDMEGIMPADSGCILCTAGTVPFPLDTGKCAYHRAVDTLLYNQKDPFQK